MNPPVNQTLFKQPCVLVLPDHPVAEGSARPESQHVDVESVDQLEASPPLATRSFLPFSGIGPILADLPRR